MAYKVCRGALMCKQIIFFCKVPDKSPIFSMFKINLHLHNSQKGNFCFAKKCIWWYYFIYPSDFTDNLVFHLTELGCGCATSCGSLKDKGQEFLKLR